MPNSAPQDEARSVGSRGEEGATSLEVALLLGAIVLPAGFIIKNVLQMLMNYFGMMASLNAMPFP